MTTSSLLRRSGMWRPAALLLSALCLSLPLASCGGGGGGSSKSGGNGGGENSESGGDENKNPENYLLGETFMPKAVQEVEFELNVPGKDADLFFVCRPEFPGSDNVTGTVAPGVSYVRLSSTTTRLASGTWEQQQGSQVLNIVRELSFRATESASSGMSVVLYGINIQICGREKTDSSRYAILNGTVSSGSLYVDPDGESGSKERQEYSLSGAKVRLTYTTSGQ